MAVPILCDRQHSFSSMASEPRGRAPSFDSFSRTSSIGNLSKLGDGVSPSRLSSIREAVHRKKTGKFWCKYYEGREDDPFFQPSYHKQKANAVAAADSRRVTACGPVPSPLSPPPEGEVDAGLVAAAVAGGVAAACVATALAVLYARAGSTRSVKSVSLPEA